MSGTVTFDGAPPPGTIHFGVGQPSADLLPVDLVRQASQSFFDNAHPFELNYGVLQGDERFLDSLAAFLSDGYGSEVTSDQLFVTGGNSQALDLVSVAFANPGDTVFVEEPSYFLAFPIFRDHGLNIVGIPVDDDGLGVDAIRRELQSHKPRFCTRFRVTTTLAGNALQRRGDDRLSNWRRSTTSGSSRMKSISYSITTMHHHPLTAP